MKFIAVLPGKGDTPDVVVKTDDYTLGEICEGKHIRNIRDDFNLPFPNLTVKLYDENMNYLQDILVNI